MLSGLQASGLARKIPCKAGFTRLNLHARHGIGHEGESTPHGYLCIMLALLSNLHQKFGHSNARSEIVG